MLTYLFFVYIDLGNQSHPLYLFDQSFVMFIYKYHGVLMSITYIDYIIFDCLFVSVNCIDKVKSINI